MKRFSPAVLALALVSAFAIAAPIEQFGMKPGTIHRMALGGGECADKRKRQNGREKSLHVAS